MKVGFFLALRKDVQHYLHAASLVREVRRRMPGVDIDQFSDEKTPMVPDVSGVRRMEGSTDLLELRLSHYSICEGPWLLVDTDVSVRADVRGVFDDPYFDVALCDRIWPHLLSESQHLSVTMPFNTGVVFSRSSTFWSDVLDVWRTFTEAERADWMSEQRAVYHVVRSGRHKVKILSGMDYNYPPAEQLPIPVTSAMVHYKGPRKSLLTKHAYAILSQP